MIVGLCRFSYSSIGGWRKTPNSSSEETQEFLFDEARLEKRFRLFEGFTIPSMLSQTDQDFKFVVLASQSMPESYKIRLGALCDRVPQAHVSFQPRTLQRRAMRRCLGAAFGSELSQITFKLDDDDALSADYIERLRRIALQYGPGHAFSFGDGVTLRWVEGRGQCILTSIPFASAGLALFVDRTGLEESRAANVYSLAHNRFYQLFPTIVSGGGLAYVRTLHGTNDSFGQLHGGMRNPPLNEQEFEREARKQFPFSLRPWKPP